MVKGKRSPTPSKATVTLDPEVAKSVADLKNTGNKAFAEKDYGEAMKQYDSALSVLPAGSIERADLLCNKAACFFALNRYKEAVKECGNALEVNPSSAKAMRHRARALEKQGLYKQALADIQTINKSDSASDDSRQAERRLKDLLAGRRPSLANGGARAAGPGGAATAAAAARGARSPLNWPFTAKVSLGNETRLIQLTANSSYGDLLAQVAAKFPNAGPCLLKYVDKEGDLVTITSRGDVQAALAEALQGADRRLGLIPPIKVTLTQVASKAEVPQVPLDEQQEAQMMLQQQMAAAAAAQHQAAAAGGQKQQAQTTSGELIEIDDWLVEFANMFRETTNIDADRHIESQNDGWALTTRAMEALVHSDEALPLFDKAAERFKEVIATGYINWGNVFVCMGHKLLDAAALADKEIDDALTAQVTAEFDKAAAKFQEAAAVKADFPDLLVQLATLEFERAKLAAKLLAKPAATPDTAAFAADAEGAAKAQQEAQTAATKEALNKVKAADVLAARPHWEAANKLYRQAVDAAIAVEEARKAEQAAKQPKAANGSEGGDAVAAGASSGGSAEPSLAAPELSLPGHAQVLWGNHLYEWSQLLAAGAQEDWRAVLDQAVELFKVAGCAEPDIRNALKNHTQVDKLDLGPDPEPEPPATPAAAQPAAAAAAQQQQQQHKPVPPEAKGLPKLERKPKDKGAAAAPAAQ